jgi:hypothetical protein
VMASWRSFGVSLKLFPGKVGMSLGTAPLSRTMNGNWNQYADDVRERLHGAVGDDDLFRPVRRLDEPAVEFGDGRPQRFVAVGGRIPQMDELLHAGLDGVLDPLMDRKRRRPRGQVDLAGLGGLQNFRRKPRLPELPLSLPPLRAQGLGLPFHLGHGTSLISVCWRA